ncbi:non-structural maintenance of chromosomes element 1 homolog isoform X2 [Dreissena polymorpha]|uniref:non-structural maintenance of chromosomes element 1 homolog isoform X2 n=1 Tax=Dreissena polymorpha TaxID=45954 RepID=UPI0022656AB5|nr:non-structural maintenance of chromosomes element 1 homolog isoform X2 [Dreissena polymorpha]
MHMSKQHTMQKLKSSHHMFIQAFMTRGVMNGTEVFNLLKLSCEKYGDYDEASRTQLLLDYCHTINSNISMLGLEIKKGKDETNGTGYYGLVNTVESNITLLASQYTENELQFFKMLLEEFVKSESGTIGSIEALGISEKIPKKMSKTDANQLLDRFEREKWIGKSKEGRMYLGIRGVMEMEQYIFEMFEDFAVRCNMCKKLCIQGARCMNGECETRMHFHCAQRVFRGKSEKRCPECRGPWQESSQTRQADQVEME